MKKRELLVRADRSLEILWPARVVALALLLVVVLSAAIAPRAALGQSTETPPAAAPPLSPAAAAQTGVIAYVEDTNRDEIRLINPDGSNDRRLWGHNVADASDVYDISTLAWRPNAAELAFASSHESWCSINGRDIFTISADGRNYRRVTEAPACAALSAFAQGTVRVPVENDNIFGESFTGFVYFQGAPGLQFVSLPPGGSTVVTFNNVADFGDGELQVGAMIVGFSRDVSIGTAVDVKANATVTTGPMSLYVPDVEWGVHSPTWRSDGSAIGYVLNFNSVRAISPNPMPLDFGTELQTDQSAMPDFVDLLTWGPASRANQLLYRGNISFDAQGIYLMPQGSATAGQRLVTYETYQFVRGLAWLPDGSGFVYSVEELDDSFTATRANVFVYRFSNGQPVRLTNFTNQFAGQLSVSPDGTQVVFERAAAQEAGAPTDLWLVGINGTGVRRLVEDGGAPAWSPGAPATPRRAYLPVTLRPR